MLQVMGVGRLYINSDGLLVLSTDGSLTQAMMHPDSALSRVYRVRLKGRLTEQPLAMIAKGIVIEGVSYRAAELIEETGDNRANTWYRATLREGKTGRSQGCLITSAAW
jgi:23S rRNA pseudouridine2605 synthase